MSGPLSLNLTTGTHTAVAADGYGAPMFVTEDMVVLEVVFWSHVYNTWIVLVRDRTAREWPADGTSREVSVDELAYYGAALEVPHAGQA